MAKLKSELPKNFLRNKDLFITRRYGSIAFRSNGKQKKHIFLVIFGRFNTSFGRYTEGLY